MGKLFLVLIPLGFSLNCGVSQKHDGQKKTYPLKVDQAVQPPIDEEVDPNRLSLSTLQDTDWQGRLYEFAEINPPGSNDPVESDEQNEEPEVDIVLNFYKKNFFIAASDGKRKATGRFKIIFRKTEQRNYIVFDIDASNFKHFGLAGQRRLMSCSHSDEKMYASSREVFLELARSQN